ncbi:MAG: EF-hand domain-containing protein [Aliivibrio sp.]|uniref:hypothetical protein n=1 Tax=Aliivibrio sp. TaxID=1872443 RepID=UPI001A5E261E|nr:EF-hand domain-containing protein [Aliivibrio sp.]
MNINVYVVIALTTTCLLTANIAVAKNGFQWNNNMPNFTQIDSNSDDMIDVSEFDQFREQRISERKAEGRRMKNLNKNTMFTMIDSNGDGVISSAEFTQHQQSNRKFW